MVPSGVQKKLDLWRLSLRRFFVPKIKIKFIPMFIEERKFDYWMNRLVAHFETVNRKIDKLSNTENKINDEVLLDNQDLCLLLKVSKRTLQRFRSSGKLPYKRIGKKTYYLESDVHKFIQNGFSKIYNKQTFS
jgi:hypothetical protein